jgi:hypothetical protein
MVSRVHASLRRLSRGAGSGESLMSTEPVRPPGRSKSGGRRPFLACALTVGLLCASAFAGVDIVDISPDSSTYYQPTSAFGASGGRINGLAAVAGSDLVYYAASEWGGIFKTTDGGVTWDHLDGHVPMATWDVEVNPAVTDIVYATSFFDGRTAPRSGVEVSYDGGLTWVRPPSATPDLVGKGNVPADFDCSQQRIDAPSAFGIAVQADAPQNVYAGTNCGLAISNDFGASWRFVDPTPGVSRCKDGSDACDVWDVVVHHGGIIDICGDDGHYRSTDGGGTWSGGTLPWQVPANPGDPPVPGGRSSIAASPDESYVLFVADDAWTFYGDAHNVYESDDGGASWVRLGTPYLANGCAAGHCPKRIPFVTTNKRSDDNGHVRFNLWYGEEALWRADCETPQPPQPGGPTRCPAPTAQNNWPVKVWENSGGVHGDSGDLVFQGAASVDACPALYSSDGGVYYLDPSVPDCQDPSFLQPARSPHALWLWGLGGSNLPSAAVALHFGVQDDGFWASPDATSISPIWNDGPSSDSFTVAADAARVVRLDQDGSFGAPTPGVWLQSPGSTTGTLVSTPTTIVAFRFADSIARFGDRKYAIVGDDGKVYVTQDITAATVQWSQLGTNLPAGGCGIRSSVDQASGDPVFYLQVGQYKTSSCNQALYDRVGDQLWRYVGVGQGGTWQRIDTRIGSGGVGIFGVDPADADSLYASNLDPSGPHMVRSRDGGLSWQVDPELDDMMTGGGDFVYDAAQGPENGTGFDASLNGYPQPTLAAFDPYDPEVLVAGGRDSGLFLSTNRGADWSLLTDPRNPGVSGVPHIPRPWFAHFRHDPQGTIWLYVGTQGRGVWRLRIRQPVATAGGPYTTVEGTDVILDAGASSDPDGKTLSFVWDFDDDGVYDDAVGAQVTFDRVGQDGVFPVRVKVEAEGVFTVASSTVTVANVAPSVVVDSDAPIDENAPVTVTGTVSDPGWEDPLTATIDWGDGTGQETISGTAENIRPNATLSFTIAHIYGDNGLFTATLCGADDDTTTCQTISLGVDNVVPTAVIDTSGSVLVNGVETFVAHVDEPLDFSAGSQDPGSDDLRLAWDWDDGPPAPDVVVDDLVNPPLADTLPSPTIQPRDVTDARTHTFDAACLYGIAFSSADDDGGLATDAATVVIAGSADLARSAGYWKHEYVGNGKVHFDVETLQCYLDIVGHMSQVFDEIRSAATLPQAAAVLALQGSNLRDLLDRQLLAAWLNFANGAFDLDEEVDTDGDHVPDATFFEAMTDAETVRANPASTQTEIERQKDIIERLNLRDGG